MRCTRVKIILVALLACTASLAFGQISGIVHDDQGEALDGVHVWLSGTQSGDLTDEHGTFSLLLNHSGPIEIVASHIGYRLYKQGLTVRDTARSLNIRMRASSIEIDEVLVTAQSSKKRKKWLKQFEKAFFGDSDNAKLCEILNPDVLLFEKTQDGLNIVALDVLQLRNGALGYDVLLKLEHASIQDDAITYSGKYLFESIDSTDSKYLSRRDQARRKAFRGSMNHFFLSLIANRLRAEKFSISEVQVASGQITEEIARGRDQVLREGRNAGEYVFMFNRVLKLTYFGEDDHDVQEFDKIGGVGRTLGRPAEQDMISQEKNALGRAQSGQVSYLFLKKVPVLLLEGGYLKNPRLLEEQGYLATERFADLLPLEYSAGFNGEDIRSKKPKSEADVSIAATTGSTETNDAVINGFSLTDLQIDKDEIKSGGPPRDGIRAIDDPIFVHASDAQDIDDDEMVLGIVIDNVARAYPARILDRHEIVNDVIAQMPLAISYCPLCNSGIGFGREIGGVIRTFGVSGLLYNSDVLMFDRETESLWSQIMGSAISGEESGAELKFLPVVMSSWSWWKGHHPDSEVLIGGEGVSARYSSESYSEYRSSQSLMFPVAEQSKALRNKDMVIGISLGDQAMAYPYNELAKSKETVSDELNGQVILVHYDEEQNTAWITDESGVLLAAESMYWFAWYAFHTDTQIFESVK